MNYIIADSIISPLAVGTENNLNAILQGKTALKKYDGEHLSERFQPPLFPPVEPFMAAMFGEEVFQNPDFREIQQKGFDRFETLCIFSIQEALKDKKINLQGEDVLFILSTTKGDVELIHRMDNRNTPEENEKTFEQFNPLASIKKIASVFTSESHCMVVSNACISGVCAIITADRFLKSGRYKTAVVVGCDILSPFIVSGFQALHALSASPCRPFDKERTGLNLGEACACLILSADPQYTPMAYGTVLAGSIHNDANHISGPSRTGEGLFRCIKDVLPADIQNIAFINAHGTGTPYNDEMESIALERTGLQHTPLNALKGFYGHTLGTAGLLETILSLQALKKNTILPTPGYEQQGTSVTLNITKQIQHTRKKEFIKLMSGFGGVNATIRIGTDVNQNFFPAIVPDTDFLLTMGVLFLSDKPKQQTTEENNRRNNNCLTKLYKEQIKDYPKFYKMDGFCQLGFIAAESCIMDFSRKNFDPSLGVPEDAINADMAVIMAGKHGCISTDLNYKDTIKNPNDYFPSPALFVYTLPNIVTGEIAIRHKTHGETSFYFLDNEDQLQDLAEFALLHSNAQTALVGWVDFENEKGLYAHFWLVMKK